MSRKYKFWTTKEQQLAIDLRKKGKTCGDIGKILGDRSPNEVRLKLNRLGVKCCSPQLWTSEEWELAQDLRYMFDLRLKDIADVLDRDELSIKNKFYIERRKEREKNE